MSAASARAEPVRLETDVLVIGSGAAGMYASVEAARAGCRVLLIVSPEDYLPPAAV